MRRLLLCGMGIALVLGSAVAQENAAISKEAAPRVEVSELLKAKTEVKLIFAQSISSKHAFTGEKVELRLADDVKVGDLVVIAKGARVLGTVVQGKKNERRGNSKDLAVSVDYILVDGMKVKLTGVQEQKAKTNAGAATASAIAFGLGGLLIYMDSRESWIREGTPVTAYIAEDVELIPVVAKAEGT
jgi:hypothetical protein